MPQPNHEYSAEYWRLIAIFNSANFAFLDSLTPEQQGHLARAKEAAAQAPKVLATIAPEGFQVCQKTLQQEARIICVPIDEGVAE